MEALARATENVEKICKGALQDGSQVEINNAALIARSSQASGVTAGPADYAPLSKTDGSFPLSATSHPQQHHFIAPPARPAYASVVAYPPVPVAGAALSAGQYDARLSGQQSMDVDSEAVEAERAASDDAPFADEGPSGRQQRQYKPLRAHFNTPTAAAAADDANSQSQPSQTAAFLEPSKRRKRGRGLNKLWTITRRHARRKVALAAAAAAAEGEEEAGEEAEERYEDDDQEQEGIDDAAKPYQPPSTSTSSSRRGKPVALTSASSAAGQTSAGVATHSASIAALLGARLLPPPPALLALAAAVGVTSSGAAGGSPFSPPAALFPLPPELLQLQQKQQLQLPPDIAAAGISPDILAAAGISPAALSLAMAMPNLSGLLADHAKGGNALSVAMAQTMAQMQQQQFGAAQQLLTASALSGPAAGLLPPLLTTGVAGTAPSTHASAAEAEANNDGSRTVGAVDTAPAAGTPAAVDSHTPSGSNTTSVVFGGGATDDEGKAPLQTTLAPPLNHAQVAAQPVPTSSRAAGASLPPISLLAPPTRQPLPPASPQEVENQRSKRQKPQQKQEISNNGPAATMEPQPPSAFAATATGVLQLNPALIVETLQKLLQSDPQRALELLVHVPLPLLGQLIGSVLNVPQLLASLLGQQQQQPQSLKGGGAPGGSSNSPEVTSFGAAASGSSSAAINELSSRPFVVARRRPPAGAQPAAHSDVIASSQQQGVPRRKLPKRGAAAAAAASTAPTSSGYGSGGAGGSDLLRSLDLSSLLSSFPLQLQGSGVPTSGFNLSGLSQQLQAELRSQAFSQQEDTDSCGASASGDGSFFPVMAGPSVSWAGVGDPASSPMGDHLSSGGGASNTSGDIAGGGAGLPFGASIFLQHQMSSAAGSGGVGVTSRSSSASCSSGNNGNDDGSPGTGFARLPGLQVNTTQAMIERALQLSYNAAVAGASARNGFNISSGAIAALDALSTMHITSANKDVTSSSDGGNSSGGQSAAAGGDVKGTASGGGADATPAGGDKTGLPNAHQQPSSSWAATSAADWSHFSLGLGLASGTHLHNGSGSGAGLGLGPFSGLGAMGALTPLNLASIMGSVNGGGAAAHPFAGLANSFLSPLHAFGITPHVMSAALRAQQQAATAATTSDQLHQQRQQQVTEPAAPASRDGGDASTPVGDASTSSSSAATSTSHASGASSGGSRGSVTGGASDGSVADSSSSSASESSDNSGGSIVEAASSTVLSNGASGSSEIRNARVQAASPQASLLGSASTVHNNAFLVLPSPLAAAGIVIEPASGGGGGYGGIGTPHPQLGNNRQQQQQQKQSIGSDGSMAPPGQGSASSSVTAARLRAHIAAAAARASPSPNTRLRASPLPQRLSSPVPPPTSPTGGRASNGASSRVSTKSPASLAVEGSSFVGLTLRMSPSSEMK